MKIINLFKGVILVLMVGAAFNSQAKEEGRLLIGSGLAGVFDSSQLVTFKVGYEFSPQTAYWKIRPLLQFIGTDTGAYHVSLGGIRDFEINQHWYWSVSTAIGYYKADNSATTEELGHELEFYSSIALSYAMNENTAVRLELGHISNGGFGAKNPGSESAILSAIYSF